jgi:K+-sensing histidine kinase KdpD
MTVAAPSVIVSCETESKDGKHIDLKMQQQSEELRTVISNTAHDLKTPLQELYFGSAEVVTQCDGLVTLSGEQLSLAISNLKKSALGLERSIYFMNMSINRSIDFLKSGHGIGLVASESSIDIWEAISYTILCIRSIQDRVAVDVDCDLAISMLSNYIVTDSSWLKDNILCLLSNAVKFSKHGDVKLVCAPVVDASGRVKAYSEVEVGFLRFEVHDHGVGIPLDQRYRLFEPLVQTERRSGGAGLGLCSLSKRVEALGGKCGIESRHDNESGSLVWFSIPYVPDKIVDPTLFSPKGDPKAALLRANAGHEMKWHEQNAAESKKALMNEEVSRDEVVNGRVLLIEDSPLLLKLLKRGLEAARLHVIVATNGAEALEYLVQQLLFDAIITDIQMPVSGLFSFPLVYD